MGLLQAAAATKQHIVYVIFTHDYRNHCMTLMATAHVRKVQHRC